MIPALPFALAATVLYFSAGLWQAMALARRVALRPHPIQFLGGLGAVSHAVVVYFSINATHGVNLGLSESASLACWMMAALLIVISLFKPIIAAAAVLLPVAGLSVMAVVSLPGNMIESGFTPGILVHIATSILAYALLSIAAVLSILLAFQQHALKKHHLRGIVQVLPPLVRMERLLFEAIGWGMFFLSLAIVSGFLFVDNLFAQHLIHKTVLSLMAWVLFGVLLWGHHQKGWRGQRAVRWTLAGSALLLMAYLGSKLAMTLIY
ncbi:cytochrome C assembly family protein [Larsenimonas suaedae]|uniref:Cytochrome c biogenesis protein CcsA n=1 Tax=Larsenimonas suaedae TaxID=1851019 RepID=A0ABU1GX05_9GAMM|nr:cytochrome c biogenesis protein CcsA [Larsenimonas suaedae]MCM2973151.1 cytochrome c biogenesis protein CcsA [Larsenimonas suaedae]MDR5896588.1 cytochrome c biogenesis protein CcsA [Larsenimonas suaedae]